MAKRIAVTNLDTSTINILNVIRANAPTDYQNSVPKVTKASEIPKVGEYITGTPAFSNHFVNALINRIALVKIQSMTFNNPYSRLKKGYLENGETVEDIFIGIAKVMVYSAEKAESRELKRYLPNVKSAFYTLNWKVMYPVSVENAELKLAFLSLQGVEELIARVVQSVYNADSYDEYLLFKYMLIKGATRGAFYPVTVDRENFVSASGKYRGVSNKLLFPSTNYNAAGVLNNTPRERQVIFMDALYNGDYDSEALASAFNMDKRSYLGSLYLIDDWASFDNSRWSEIQEESDMVEPVTPAELNIMKSVVAIAVDSEFFQVYDNELQFTEKYVASGLRWNYFLHSWKTVAWSPFANGIAFVDSTAVTAPPEELDVELISKSISAEGTALAFKAGVDNAGFAQLNPQFVQTEALTTAGIGVQPYGEILIPASQSATEVTLEISMAGTKYTTATTVNAASVVGTKLTFTKSAGSARKASAK